MPKTVSVSGSATTPKKRKAERAVAMALKKQFKVTKDKYVPRMVKKYKAIMEQHRKGLNDEADFVLKQLDLTDWVELVESISGPLSDAEQDAAKRALTALKINDQELFDQVSETAVSAAEDRAAELVGMKWNGDKLVPNPSADMAITESTRSGIRQLVVKSLTDGLTVDQLSNELEGSYQFSNLRAETIARTELASAHVEGTLTAWKTSGLVEGKRWLLGSEHPGIEDECDENEADGVIDLDDVFSSGDDGPPAHPNCVCAVVSSLRVAKEE